METKHNSGLWKHTASSYQIQMTVRFPLLSNACALSSWSHLTESGQWPVVRLILCLNYATGVVLPCASKIQRFGGSLPYLTAIEIERVSVCVGCQLPTATSYHSALDGLPVCLSDSCWLKIILNITGKVVTKNGAIITYREGNNHTD